MGKMRSNKGVCPCLDLLKYRCFHAISKFTILSISSSVSGSELSGDSERWVGLSLAELLLELPLLLVGSSGAGPPVYACSEQERDDGGELRGVSATEGSERVALASKS